MKAYTVAVTGIADDVNSLNAKDVIGVVDMNQILDKLAMTEWQVLTQEKLSLTSRMM